MTQRSFKTIMKLLVPKNDQHVFFAELSGKIYEDLQARIICDGIRTIKDAMISSRGSRFARCAIV